MQLTVIPRTPPFGCVLLYCRGHSWHILFLAHRAQNSYSFLSNSNITSVNFLHYYSWYRWIHQIKSLNIYQPIPNMATWWNKYMYLLSSLHKQDVTPGQFVKRNSEFFFSGTNCHNKVKELSLPYYLSKAGWRIAGCIPFPTVLCNS